MENRNEYIPVYTIDMEDNTGCCPNLMINGYGNWYCSKYQHSFGYERAGAIASLSFCRTLYRENNFCIISDNRKKEIEEIENKYINLVNSGTDDLEAKKICIIEYTSKGYFDIAIEELLKLKCNDDDKNSLLANVYIQKKDFIKGREYADLAYNSNPDNVLAILSQGCVHSEYGEYKEAINKFNRAIEIDPNYEPAKKMMESTLKKQTEHIKEKRRRIAQVLSFVSAALAVIMVFILGSLESKPVLFLAFNNVISFVMIFLSDPYKKARKNIFLCVNIFISILVMISYIGPHQLEEEIISAIGYGVFSMASVITAFIFPKRKG